MSTKKWIDKKKGQTFALVHRSRDDPLFYDEEAGESVFVPVHTDNKQRAQGANIRLATGQDLEEEFSGKTRVNEGEAALYGIPFDDTEYDYMQHLRPIGHGDGIFIAKDGDSSERLNKGDIKIRLPEELLPVPSETKVKIDYQNQQEIPDAIGGFQPDMDPDLREVLEALDNDAYLDETQDVEDGDVFADLLASGAKGEGEDDEEFDEYDLDNYEDEYENYDSGNEGDNWEKDFAKFKKSQDRSKTKNDWDSDDDFDSEDEPAEENEEEEEDVLTDLPNIGGSKSTKGAKKKERRKKGAMTDTSSFSMTSSALERTEGLRLLDERYEVIKQKYDDEEEEDDYQPFDFKNERSDFEGMIDDFLDNYTLEAGGRRLVKRNLESEKLQKAADSVSNTKLAARRKKEAEKSMKGLTKGVSSLKF